MRAPRLLHVLAAAVAVASLSVACTAHDSGKITIGVKFDQPGLSVKKPDGTLGGFDVDVARYVAGRLGYPPQRIAWLEAPSGQREMLLRNGQVDYVVATYSITDSRRQKVDFAGPYLLAGQSLLVRADNTDITGTASLQRHKKLCSVSGSTPAQRIKDRYPGVQLQRYDTYSACVEALRNNAIDAVTTDDVILAGYAAQSPGAFKLVGGRFSEEKYGIGVGKGNDVLRQRINDALEQMERDGSWRAAFVDNFGAAGFAVPDPPPIER
ncbi:glutamate ABC transporter substrate-binding protein [Mycolicibacter sinensis]|uniref:Glutamate-binding protein n=1 Tax=Mycolicibacter sinensis (strain JDM601) TaxID=875328 RepID=A0A1A3U8A8_MYCSD|nr:glutamate ABC transporter substrate-binding protein [Mycolicibacter sinensis]MDD7814063.1 glutamate ABC transporter substrate-binding protein [Mycobacterium sp. CSUR Q5927]OBK91069.1 glutamate-binding protein [Mycolicibacter sinensis]